MAAKVVVVLAQGFEEIEAVTVIDVLRRAGLEVVVAGLDDKVVSGSHDIRITCDATIDAVEGTPDAVVLPGGTRGAEALGESSAVRELVKAVGARGGVVGAICAAPALALARFGVLDGRTATCYPSFESHFPKSARHSEDRVVVDGRLVTSRSPGTALEFAVKLAEVLAGAVAARKLREAMLVAIL